jgi:hypothetical protein
MFELSELPDEGNRLSITLLKELVASWDRMVPGNPAHDPSCIFSQPVRKRDAPFRCGECYCNLPKTGICISAEEEILALMASDMKTDI